MSNGTIARFTALFLAATALGCADAVPMGGALATGQKGITSIAVDDFYLYMAIADGSIKKVSLDGGPVITIASGQNNPRKVALDADHVYWRIGLGGIARAPKAGGDAVTLVDSADEIGDITIGDEHVYFTVPRNSAGLGEIKRAAKTPGELPITLASQQLRPRPIAGLVGGVYWGNAGDDAISGSVMSLSESDGALPQTLIGQQNPTALAVTTTHVYWRNSGNDGPGEVAWAHLGGGEAHVVATGQAAVGQVAGDEANVYWTSFDGAQMRSTLCVAPLAGGPPQEFASGPQGAVSLALDMTSVYWANDTDGAVMMMPRF